MVQDSGKETQVKHSDRAREFAAGNIEQLASGQLQETQGSWLTSGMPDEDRILPLSHLKLRPLHIVTHIQISGSITQQLYSTPPSCWE